MTSVNRLKINQPNCCLLRIFCWLKQWLSARNVCIKQSLIRIHKKVVFDFLVHFVFRHIVVSWHVSNMEMIGGMQCCHIIREIRWTFKNPGQDQIWSFSRTVRTAEVSKPVKKRIRKKSEAQRNGHGHWSKMSGRIKDDLQLKTKKLA